MEHKSLLFVGFFHLRKSLIIASKNNKASKSSKNSKTWDFKIIYFNTKLYFILPSVWKKMQEKKFLKVRELCWNPFLMCLPINEVTGKRKFKSKFCLNLNPPLNSTEDNVKMSFTSQSEKSLYSLAFAALDLSYRQIKEWPTNPFALKKSGRIATKDGKDFLVLALSQKGMWTLHKNQCHNTHKLEGSIK